LTRIPSDSGAAISVSNSPEFPEDKIKTSWVSGNDIHDYIVTVQLNLEQDLQFVPLEIVDEWEKGSDM
jgi:hypothetical protein